MVTRKALWNRSGGSCAFPGCGVPLVAESAAAEGFTVVGVEAHIVAREPAGARGNSSMVPEERDKYPNLILLCANHHKVIDSDEATYTVDQLQEWKRIHEERALQDETPEQAERRRVDGVYAQYIDEWVQRSDLDNWEGWTSWLLSSGQPSFRKTDSQRSQMLADWLFNRVWPGREKGLEAAFLNFRVVLNDLLVTFFRHAEDLGHEYMTRKIYRDAEGLEDYEERSERLLEVFNDHVDLVEDLVLELTRAANYVCDKVRESLDPSFRIAAGAATVTYGPTLPLGSWTTILPSYQADERVEIPYPGLGKFKTARLSRDHCFARYREEDL